MEHFQLTALVIFYALFIGRTMYLYRRGDQVLVIGRGKQGSRAFVERLFMAALALWTYEIVMRCFGSGLSLLPTAWRQPLFASPLADMAGAAAIVAGLIIFAAALVAFGRSWRIGIDHDRPGELVTGGIFAWTRNPIFLFLDLYFIGTWLIQRDLFFLLFAVAAVAGIHYQIRQEERFLLDHYGDDYQRYMQSVPRYVGCCG
jgi:protein-S-isoprenylcysteine O-methyltransferase Ste14